MRNAVHDMMRFWLHKGIDGFRVCSDAMSMRKVESNESQLDVINMISKVHGYPDAPLLRPNSVTQPGGLMYING